MDTSRPQSSDHSLRRLYGDSLALLTDLYQLTMAYGYWKAGRHEREAVFHQFYRRNPYGGGFAVLCGIDEVAEFLEGFRFRDDDLAYLAGLQGPSGTPLFEPAFLDYLREMRLECEVDAIPEGTVVFPREPLLRIRGPLLQAQLLETPLLSLVNFSTLVATKAARLSLVSDPDSVLEFGLRRAQGIDGGTTASRAAYIGGCAATSNMLAGKLHDIPVMGTHAHSWIMSFDGEEEAFATYADAYPDDCVLLVDTYDTPRGVQRAIAVGQELETKGHVLRGVRLDSGDLGELARVARRLLDEAGLHDTKIVASGDLDEFKVRDLAAAGAPIDLWGVGTSLAVGRDDAALDGVYKLAAIRDAEGNWQDRVKASNTPAKSTIPGILGVRRYRRDGRLVADVIHEEREPLDETVSYRDAADPEVIGAVGGSGETFEDLLQPLLRDGQCVAERPSGRVIRERVREQLESLPAELREFTPETHYTVGLERRVFERRDQMLRAIAEERTNG